MPIFDFYEFFLFVTSVNTSVCMYAFLNMCDIILVGDNIVMLLS